MASHCRRASRRSSRTAARLASQPRSTVTSAELHSPLRVVTLGLAVALLPVLASCGSGNGTPPVASIASVPTTVSTPVPMLVPTAGTAIGDTCPVGTWRVTTAREVLSFESPQGIVSITVVGGAGGVNDYFTNGTVVEDLTGAPLTGSALGYRVVMRATGIMRSPVVFLEGA